MLKGASLPSAARLEGEEPLGQGQPNQSSIVDNLKGMSVV